ncbi:hypothetical protein ABW21_db0200799 [Orbilia brochopaga]|nr:hypothetical protein ABW21_db0200799 [Drechslerella brochopaga]
MLASKSVIFAIFLAVLSQVCVAIPLIVFHDGKDLELDMTPFFHKKAGINNNGGTKRNRTTNHAGHFSKFTAFKPTNPALILQEMLLMVEKLVRNSGKFVEAVAANPTKLDIPKKN